MESLTELLRWTLILSCLGSGMMAGLFVSFSTFMMKALGSLDSSNGMQAMQAINRTILRPSFLLVFLGTAVLAAVSGFIAYALVKPWLYIIAAAAIYIFACVLSTGLFNAPLNDLLEQADAATDEGRCLWRDYLTQWTNWNHVRSFACVLSTILLAYSLSELGRL